MTFNGIWSSFNAGEFSPLIDGRVDQDKYGAGCKTLLNFIPSVQGPAIRRAGTRYVGASKGNGKAWLVPFIFSSAQSYVLEFGDGYLRFWANRGQLLSGGSPYEIASPYSQADLTDTNGACTLRYAQSADVMWIVLSTGTKPPYKLQRLGATNWTLAPAPLAHGPFDDTNYSLGTTVTASAQTGTVTLTASSSIFSAEHIGCLFYVESSSPYSIGSWEGNVTVGAGQLVRANGSVYKATGGGTTGTETPVTLYGNQNDGGITWTYQHSNRGFVQITGVTSGTVATGTVITDGITNLVLPSDVVSGGTKLWAHASFNSVKGYPTDVTFFKNRLTYVQGRTAFLSVVAGYDDFDAKDGPSVTSETALKLKIAAKKLDALRWCEQGRALILGTSMGELALAEMTTQKVFAADNAQVTPQTEFGSARVRPVKVGEAVLFVQRGGKRIREAKYDGMNDRYQAEDLNVLAPHVLKAGVLDMAFALEPDNVLWAVVGDGTLAALTYNRERGVVGWTRHQIGGATGSISWGVVEAVCVIPAPDETRDDVWLLVRRTINGATVRYLEFLEDYTAVDTNGMPYAFYVDAGITYAGAATSTVGGLSHLEGETVQVLVDGSVHADRVVSGGTISLDRSGARISVGKGFTSTLQTMRPEWGAQGGSGQGRRRSTAEVYLRLASTVGGKAGPRADLLDPIAYATPQDAVGTPPALFTGDKRLSFAANYDADGYVFVQQDQPLPMTIAAIIPKQDVSNE